QKNSGIYQKSLNLFGRIKKKFINLQQQNKNVNQPKTIKRNIKKGNPKTFNRVGTIKTLKL
ncbi:MAG: hypothetical protein IJ895_05710, partial [Prevotella sp.]|nr:hypothetical protein [Prevotella sp.]